jgi:hypothetical protein
MMNIYSQVFLISQALRYRYGEEVKDLMVQGAEEEMKPVRGLSIVMVGAGCDWPVL